MYRIYVWRMFFSGRSAYLCTGRNNYLKIVLNFLWDHIQTLYF